MSARLYTEAVVGRCAEACKFVKKEALAHVFSCDFCETFMNTFFIEFPPVAASVYLRNYIVSHHHLSFMTQTGIYFKLRLVIKLKRFS